MPFDVSTSARDALAATNARLAEAKAVRDEAQQAHDRLVRPAQLLEEAIAAHAIEKLAFDSRLVDWYQRGCCGERPVTPPSLLLAEHRIGEARRDLGASENALQDAADALQRANEDLAILSGEHRSRVYGRAVEAAEARLQRYARPAMIHGMIELSIVQALPSVLRSRSDPEAMSAAHRIDEMIVVARSSIGVRCDLEPAYRFLVELERDPGAELSDAGEPTIEAIDPPIIKPLPDWSKFINRGPEPEAPQSNAPFLPNPALDSDAAWWAFHPNPLWASPASEEPGQPPAADEVSQPNSAPPPSAETGVPGPTFAPAQDRAG